MMDVNKHESVRVEGADEIQVHGPDGLITTFSADDYDGDLDVELHDYGE